MAKLFRYKGLASLLSFPWVVNLSIGYSDSTTMENVSDSKKSKKKKVSMLSRCGEYNSAIHRLQWANRKQRCEYHKNCVFYGSAVGGTCTSRIESISENQKEINQKDIVPGGSTSAASHFIIKSSDISEEHSVENVHDEEDIRTLLVPYKDITVGDDPIRALMNESLSTSAIDSLKDSHDAAIARGKEVVMEFLAAEESQDQFGQALQTIVSYDEVRANTRWLVYWGLSTPATLDAAVWQMQWQRDYWLASKEGLGYLMPTIQDAARSLVVPSSPYTSPVAAYIRSFLAPEPLADVKKQIIENVPQAEEMIVQAMVPVVLEYLESDEARETAKSCILALLAAHTESTASAGVAEEAKPSTPSPHNKEK